MIKIVLFPLLMVSVAGNFGQSSSRNISAPFFDSGENLSIENCGFWNREVKRWVPPWEAWLWSENDGCEGLIISHSTILSNTCDFSPSDFKENKLEAHVFLGECRNYSISTDCRLGRSIRGLVVKVLDVFETDNPHLIIWKTEKIPKFNDFYRPICLFNRGQEMDLVEQPDSYYEGYHFLWGFKGKGKIEPTDNCLNENGKTKIKEERLNWYLCASIPQEYGVYLQNYHNGRYFLRGFTSLEFGQKDGLNEATHSIFYDLLASIPWIVKKSSGLAIMPEAPANHPAKKFNSKNNLSFPNCGQKVRVPLRSRRKASPEILPTAAAIVGGRPSLRGKYPWHAEIKLRHEDAGFCGGTLISKRAVLTASHCLFYPDQPNANNLEVSIGLFDTQKREDFGIQTKTPGSLKIHQNYSHIAGDFENDIALLIFDEDFMATATVQPICLWNGDFDVNHIAEKPAVVVGWGLTENLEQPNLLQEATLPIKSHKDCYLHGRTFFGKYLKPGINFCAGYSNGTSACNGDSGGGLAIEKDNRWFLRGIVSFGISQKNGSETTCNPNRFSLFADVSNYMDWIVENTPDIF